MKLATFALWLPLTLGAAEIPAGTHVLLLMEQPVSTKTAKPGDRVWLRTVYPTYSGADLVLPIGTAVRGVVTRARRSGRIYGTAELELRFDEIALPDSRPVSLSAGPGFHKRQPRDPVKDPLLVAVYTVGGSLAGGLAGAVVDGLGGSDLSAPVGSLAGMVAGFTAGWLHRGKEVDLRAGTTIDVVVERAVVIP
ncbi:MAG: hypothetical protein ABI811_18105 [Acidobacteriota bacterium]